MNGEVGPFVIGLREIGTSHSRSNLHRPAISDERQDMVLPTIFPPGLTVLESPGKRILVGKTQRRIIVGLPTRGVHNVDVCEFPRVHRGLDQQVI